MNNLPFSIQADAAAWIAKMVDVGGKEAEMAGLVPGLYFFLDEKGKDKDGRIVEWYPHSFIDVGWDRPEIANAGCFAEIEILGVKLLVPSDTLERLKNKQLILETVEVGYPRPADRKRPRLRIVPEQG